MATTDKGTQLMEGLLLSQYANSPNLKEYINAYVSEMDLLFENIEEVYLGRFIENAVGAQLDVIGKILDEDRALNLPTQFFGFMEEGGSIPSDTDQFADEAAPSEGGIFKDESQVGSASYTLSDAEYRRLLLAKALVTNRKEVGSDNTYSVISTLLGRTPSPMRLLTSDTVETNRLTNGDFSNGTTDWALLNSGDLYVESGVMRATSLGDGVAAQFTQQITTEIGIAVNIGFTTVETSGAAFVAIADGVEIFNSTDIGYQEVQYVPAGVTSFLEFRTDSTVAGEYTEWYQMTAWDILGNVVREGTDTPDDLPEHTSDEVVTMEAGDLGVEWTLGSEAEIVTPNDHPDGYMISYNNGYSSAPSTELNSVGGDMELVYYGALDDWTPVGEGQALVSKLLYPDKNRSYGMWRNTNGTITFFVSPDGFLSSSATSAGLVMDDGAVHKISAKFRIGESFVDFYVDDVLLSSEVVISPALSSVYKSTAKVEVGSISAGDNILKGKSHSAQVYNGLNYTAVGGESVQDFEGNQYPVPIGETADAGTRVVQNLIGHSESFERWAVTSATVTRNVALAPDGTMTGDELDFTNTNGLVRYITATAASDKDFVASIYLKAGTTDEVGVAILGSGGGMGFKYITPTPTLTSEWQRFAVPQQFGTGGDTVRLRLQGQSTTEKLGSVYAWGGQIDDVTNVSDKVTPAEYISTSVATGDELVTNGDFADGTTGWTVGASTVVSGELVVVNIFDDQIVQYTTNVPIAGEAYAVEFDITAIDQVGATARIQYGVSALSSFPIEVGHHSVLLSALGGVDSNRLRIISLSGAAGFTIDNVSVKEATTGFQTFDTYNGNSVLGAEEVINGDFATDSDWTKGTSWTISNGVAHTSGGTNLDALTQTFATTANTSYEVTYTVSNFVSGGVIAQFSGGGSAIGTAVFGDGTHTEVLTPAANLANFDILSGGGSGAICDIDNVSIKEVFNVVTEGTGDPLPAYPQLVVDFNPDDLGDEWTLNGDAQLVSGDYAQLNGAVGSSITTPATTSNSIAGDITLIGKVSGDDLPNASTDTLIAQGSTTANRTFVLDLLANSTFLRLSWAGNVVIATVAVPIVQGEVWYYKATRRASAGTVQFFHSADGVQWTLLETVATATGLSIITTNPVEIGSSYLDDGNWKGKVYEASVSDGAQYKAVGGETVQDFEGKSHDVPVGSTAESGTRVVQNMWARSEYPELLDNYHYQIYWENNVTRAPDGTLTADKLIEQTHLGAHYSGRSASYGTYAGQTLIQSVYAKAAGRSWLIYGSANEAGRRAEFDLANGVVGPTHSDTLGHFMEDAGNGWWRCCIVITLTKANPYPTKWLATGAGQTSYQGDGISGVYLWGEMHQDVTDLVDKYTPAEYVPRDRHYAGDELVIDASASNWVPEGTNTVTDNAEGGVDVTWVDQQNGAKIYFEPNTEGALSAPTVVGTSYFLSGMVKLNTGSAALIVNGDPDNIEVITSSTEYAPFSYFSTAPNDGHFLFMASMSAGEVVSIKDLSVKEVKLTTGFQTFDTYNGNSVLGVELVDNFDAANMSFFNGSATNPSDDSVLLSYNNATIAAQGYRYFTVEIGETYVVTVNCATTGTVAIGSTGNSSDLGTEVVVDGLQVFAVKATTTIISIRLQTPVGETALFDTISLKKVTNVLTEGEGDPIYADATDTGTTYDFEGNLITLPDGVSAVPRIRNVQNYAKSSESLYGWTTVNATRDTENHVTFDTVWGKVTSPSEDQLQDIFTGGDRFVCRALLSGDGTVTLRVSDDDSATNASTTVTLTSTPTWFEVSYTLAAGTKIYLLFVIDRNNGTATEVTVDAVQYEKMTGQTNQTNSEYVARGTGLGSEYVTNGNFDSDLSGWDSSTYYDGTAIWSDGKAVVTCGLDNYMSIVQNLTVEIGKTYVFTVDYSGTGAKLMYLGYPGSAAGYWWSTAAPGTNSLSVVFTATESTTLAVTLFSYLPSSEVIYDNISVKEATNGFQQFRTLNGNTVASDVVIEGEGTYIGTGDNSFPLKVVDFKASEYYVNGAPINDIDIWEPFDTFSGGVTQLGDNDYHFETDSAVALAFTSGFAPTPITLEFEVYDYVDGFIRWREGTTSYGSSITSNGVHRQELFPDGILTLQTGGGSNSMKVRNIKVYQGKEGYEFELGQNTRVIKPIDQPKNTYTAFNQASDSQMYLSTVGEGTVVGDVDVEIRAFVNNVYTSTNEYLWLKGNFYARVKYGKIYVYHTDDTTSSIQSTPWAIQDGKMHTIRVTRKAGSGLTTLYIDGVEDASAYLNAGKPSFNENTVWLLSYGNAPMYGGIEYFKVNDKLIYTATGGESVQDFEYGQYTVPYGETTEAGDRFVQNLVAESENINGTGWISSGTQVGDVVTLPVSATAARYRPAAGEAAVRTYQVYIPAAEFWSDPDISLRISFAGLGSTWYDFTPNTVMNGQGGWITTGFYSTPHGTIDLQLANLGGAEVTCTQRLKFQVEEVTDGIDKTPSEYQHAGLVVGNELIANPNFNTAELVWFAQDNNITPSIVGNRLELEMVLGGGSTWAFAHVDVYPDTWYYVETVGDSGNNVEGIRVEVRDDSTHGIPIVNSPNIGVGTTGVVFKTISSRVVIRLVAATVSVRPALVYFDSVSLKRVSEGFGSYTTYNNNELGGRELLTNPDFTTYHFGQETDGTYRWDTGSLEVATAGLYEDMLTIRSNGGSFGNAYHESVPTLPNTDITVSFDAVASSGGSLFKVLLNGVEEYSSATLGAIEFTYTPTTYQTDIQIVTGNNGNQEYTIWDNVEIKQVNSVSPRNIELELSRQDTSVADDALITYFGKYLAPLGTGFTVTRK